MLFGLASNYSALLYVAFFKGSFRSQNIFGYIKKNSSCSVYGCMIDLTIQYVVTLIGIQITDSLWDTMVPKWGLNKRRKALINEHAKSNRQYFVPTLFFVLSSHPILGRIFFLTIKQFRYLTKMVSRCLRTTCF